MSDDVDLTLLLRNLEARCLIEWWKIEDGLRLQTGTFPDHVICKVISAAKNGYSSRQIATKAGVCQNAVVRILKANGISLKPNTIPSHVVDKVINSLREGESTYKTGKKIGLSPTTVAKIAVDAGIKLQKKKQKDNQCQFQTN